VNGKIVVTQKSIEANGAILPNEIHMSPKRFPPTSNKKLTMSTRQIQEASRTNSVQNRRSPHKSKKHLSKIDTSFNDLGKN